MSVDSHIQIPNCILKHFRSSESHTVFHLDLKDWRIHSCKSSLLGTENGYYSEYMEQYLNKEIESPLSTVVMKILVFAERKANAIVITDEDENIIKKYVTASMARSALCKSSYMDNSVFATLVEPQCNHDNLVFISTLRNGGIDPLVQNRRVFIIVNQSNRQFTVPRNSFYGIERKGCTLIIVPISPICAIALAPENYTDVYADGEACWLYVVDDADTVLEMNQKALHYEWLINQSFVAAARKQELIELKQYMERNGAAFSK